MSLTSGSPPGLEEGKYYNRLCVRLRWKPGVSSPRKAYNFYRRVAKKLEAEGSWTGKVKHLQKRMHSVVFVAHRWVLLFF